MAATRAIHQASGINLVGLDWGNWSRNLGGFVHKYPNEEITKNNPTITSLFSSHVSGLSVSVSSLVVYLLQPVCTVQQSTPDPAFHACVNACWVHLYISWNMSRCGNSEPVVSVGGITNSTSPCTAERPEDRLKHSVEQPNRKKKNQKTWKEFEVQFVKLSLHRLSATFRSLESENYCARLFRSKISQVCGWKISQLLPWHSARIRIGKLSENKPNQEGNQLHVNPELAHSWNIWIFNE